MKPLQGLTFCPTGFNDEDISRNVSKKIVKLGGCYSKDLTRQVNVLVIGRSKDTNKYRFAVRHRHDIVFIGMHVIDILYDRWLAGDDIAHGQDVNGCNAVLDMLRTRYSAPPLENFYIFIGRVDSYPLDQLEELCHLQKCYKCNSSHFVKDCKSRNDKNTVLFITDSLHGTRVQAALEQDIPIVHYKWILDCRRRNATLEYNPHYLLSRIPKDTPFEKIGLDSCECWNELVKSPLAVGASSMTAAGTTTPIVNSNANLFQKFKSQGDKIWQSAMTKSTSILPLNDSIKLSPPSSTSNTDRSKSGMIFHECSFHISKKFPEPHLEILRKVIQQNGGTIALEGEHSQYLIIPSNVPLEDLFGDKFEKNDRIIVTEFFIERCLHYQILISPPDSWSKPFLRTNDVRLVPSKNLLHEDNSLLQVAITGFHGVELLHLNKILKIMEPMGIAFVEYLNKKTDILLINLSSLPSIPHSHPLWKNHYCDLFTTQLKHDSMSNQVFRNSMKRKIQFVKQEHSIPVVTPAFLIDLFSRTANLKEKKQTVFLNNVSWCIICPRGPKQNFTIEVSSATDQSTVPPPTSFTPPINETQSKLLEKVKDAEATRRATRKRRSSLASKVSPKRLHAPSEESTMPKVLQDSHV